VFERIYDATESFKAKADMSVVHPARLHVGDVVLMECFVVRAQTTSSWTLSFHPYAISLLARAP
ncbi:hypothetical protein K466DRAFT_448646, partial [Polyporus arcularius HHB13444]